MYVNCGLRKEYGSDPRSFEQYLASVKIGPEKFNLFLFSRNHIPINSVSPFSEYKSTRKAKFLQSPLFAAANLRYQLG